MSASSHLFGRRSRSVPSGGMKVMSTIFISDGLGLRLSSMRERGTTGNGSRPFAMRTGLAALMAEHDDTEQERRVKALCEVLNAHEVSTWCSGALPAASREFRSELSTSMLSPRHRL
jgi:hypothetical protein